ncbi:tetratricopeptide repeat protein [bacterium]|nr:tetratricopeptide repeat protein [bacterium]
MPKKGVLIIGLFVILLFASCNQQPQVEMQPETTPEQDLAELEYQVKVQFSNGYEYYKNKQYTDAIDPLKMILELDSGCQTEFCEKAYRYLADTYIRLDMLDTAKVMYQEAIDKFPDKSNLHCGLAYIYFKEKQGYLDRRDSLIANVDSLEQLDPEKQNIYSCIIDSIENVNQVAILEYKKSVELDPQDCESMRQLGRIYLEDGKLDSAVAWYEKGARCDSNQVAIWKTLERLYETRRNNEGLAIAYQNLLRLQPDDQDVKLELGRVYGQLGRFDESMALLEEYTQSNPDDPKGMHYLGLVFFRQKEYTKSLEKLKQAAGLNPDSPRIQVDIAEVYRDLKKYRTANGYISKAISIDSKYYYAYFVRGEIYEGYGMAILPPDGTLNMESKMVFEEALEQYRKALKDSQWNAPAKSKIDFLKPYLATAEEKAAYIHMKGKLPEVSLEDK